jgi:hypothetical protein
MTDSVRVLIPFVGPFLIAALMLHLVLRRFRGRAFYPWVVLGGAVLLVLLPLQGLPLAGYIRGLLGDLSMLSLMLMGNALWIGVAGGQGLIQSSRSMLLLAVGLIGALFYPLALGLSGFDPYQLGYGGLLLPALLLLLSLAAWFTRRRALALLLLLPVAAYDLGLLESANLWDYLIDPWLVIYAWVWLLKRLFLRNRGQVGHSER